MPSKTRKRWRPPMKEFKKMVAIVAKEVQSANVTDVFHVVRRRCPDWSVTPHRVRKALTFLQNSSAKKKGKQSKSRAKGSADGVLRAFPHDVVELRPHAARSSQAQWQWRGQVLRVAGYDDGETAEDEMQELPPGHCYIFWLGHGLEQWPNALTKETSIRVLDRPLVLGDRVARADDPRSLGTIVGVNCALSLSGVPGPTVPSLDSPVQMVRAIGGFRAEDWVACEASRWVGKVEEAVFRIKVELCGGKGEQWPSRGRGRRKPPLCVFQVSSEGLQGLEPANGEDVTPQELSPHFPGQRVRAPARLWRQAEWLRGGLGQRPSRRGIPICGVVSSVECCLLAVRWLAGAVRDSQPPDEWVAPETLRTLAVPNSSEGWAVGDHVQAPADWHSPSAVVVGSKSVVDVRWADGSKEVGVAAMKLCPRPHISAHDFLPHDFVARSSEGLGEPPLGAVTPAALLGGAQQVQGAGNRNLENHEGNYGGYGQAPSGHENLQQDADMYGQVSMQDVAARVEAAAEILPTGGFGPPPVDTPLGVVTSVNLNARTALVQWAALMAGAGETEEVSVFELTDHPQVDVRLGDAVLIPDEMEQRWCGRICELHDHGAAWVEMLGGASQWFDVRRLIVVDDGEGSETDGMMGSEASEGEPSGEASDASEADDDSPKSRREGRGTAASDAATPEADGAFSPSWFPPCAAEEEQADDRRGSPEAAEGELPSQHHQSSASREDPARAPPAAAEDSGQAASMDMPAFDVCDEELEPTDHFFLQSATLGARARMMAARREMQVLRKGLLEGSEGVPAPIVVRTFSSRSDLFRAMVVGPPETPYEYVPFFFDLALPAEYPREPPLTHFHAHFVGNERLNPNLYVDGKVCLSLLGTWSGPAWDPQRSTLLQVLVSLQGLVLVEEPYFNEPGHECDAGTEQGKQSSALYNEHARLLALRAALSVAQNPPCGFREIVTSYFAKFGPKLVDRCEQALAEPKAAQSSEGFRRVLAKSILPRLQERWGASSSLGGGAGCAGASSASAASAPSASLGVEEAGGLPGAATTATAVGATAYPYTLLD